MIEAFALLFAMASRPSDVVDALLDVRLEPAQAESHRTAKPPGNSLDELAGYWSARASMAEPEMPSPDVAAKLTGVIEQFPRRVPDLVSIFPPTDDVCGRLAKWSESYDAHNVLEWRIAHCADERGELIARASRVHDEDGFLIDGEWLHALAVTDWNDAAPLLDYLIASAQPSVSAEALAIRARHDPSDPELRCKLQAIAVDRGAPARARDAAIETLSKSDWPGRDAWLESLFSDPTLTNPIEGSIGYAPLRDVAVNDPGRWIPVLTRLLQSSDRAVHANAANALAGFQLENARADALRPLLPWLSDPNWADSSGDERLRLTQSVAHVGLTEAIPYLIDELREPGLAEWAADALADFGASVEPAPLLDAMRKEKDEWQALPNLARAYVVCTRPAAKELADDAEAWATGGPHEAVAIGTYVIERMTPRDDVAAEILRRHPEKKLRTAIAAWPLPSVDRANAAELASLDVKTIVAMLHARERVARNAAHELASHEGGAARGIAVAIGGNRTDELKVLRSNDVDAVRALLAATRITHDSLPIDDVAALFGRSAALDSAAETWLAANDSPAARALILRRHEGEIVLIVPEVGVITSAPEIESFRASGDDEWLLLDSAGAFAPRRKIVIAIRGGHATITADGKTSPLREGAIDELRALLDVTNIDDRPSLETDVADGVQSVYFHLRRHGASRSVYMNNAWFDGGSPYDRVVRRFDELAANR